MYIAKFTICFILYFYRDNKVNMIKRNELFFIQSMTILVMGRLNNFYKMKAHFLVLSFFSV